MVMIPYQRSCIIRKYFPRRFPGRPPVWLQSVATWWRLDIKGKSHESYGAKPSVKRSVFIETNLYDGYWRGLNAFITPDVWHLMCSFFCVTYQYIIDRDTLHPTTSYLHFCNLHCLFEHLRKHVLRIAPGRSSCWQDDTTNSWVPSGHWEGGGVRRTVDPVLLCLLLCWCVLLLRGRWKSYSYVLLCWRFRRYLCKHIFLYVCYTLILLQVYSVW